MVIKRNKKNKERPYFRFIYWLSVFCILAALIMLVRNVLSRTKVFVLKETEIKPTLINWRAAEDQTLLIKEPYYLENKYKLVLPSYSVLKKDTAMYNTMTKKSNNIVNLETPYLLWKNKNSDTVFVLKNEIKMVFLPKN